MTATDQKTLSIPQAMKLAAKHHEKGELPQAEALYTEILRKDRGQIPAIHMLGLIAHQVGKDTEAVELISEVIRHRPDLPEAHNNLGIVFRDLGRLDEAVASYTTAISFKPDYADALYNLGYALHEQGKPQEAILCYDRALSINPEQIRTILNLGYALGDLGRLEEAVTTYKNALALDPAHLQTIRNLGLTYKDMGQLQKALDTFQMLDTPEFKAHVLECLFTLGKYDQLYQGLEQSREMYSTNLRAAAISAFASQQLGRDDPHPFCKNPLDFVRMYPTVEGANQSEFLVGIADQLNRMDAIWEPPGKTTKDGFQTRASLFDKPAGLLLQLEHAIKQQIIKYTDEFAAADCDLIQSFPKTLNLTGWFVRLIKGGHQTEHLHASGWLSGVFYLQVPGRPHPEEGAIELGLWGYDYPLLKDDYPTQQYYPKKGNLILFPSSLFHRTIPIHSDEDRLCIAFDVLPAGAL